VYSTLVSGESINNPQPTRGPDEPYTLCSIKDATLSPVVLTTAIYYYIDRTILSPSALSVMGKLFPSPLACDVLPEGIVSAR